MLHWALTFLILAIVSGFLGFGGVAYISAQFAQILFFIFLVMFILAAVVHALKGRYPPV